MGQKDQVNALEKTLHAVVTVLARAKVPFALIGGLAVSVRTEPRFTRDVDLALAVSSDAEAEGVVGLLREKGFLPVSTVEQAAAGRLVIARFREWNAEHSILVDLLFASTGIEAEVVRGADLISIFGGRKMPVASVGHLIAMKLLSVDARKRPQDVTDLRGLFSVASSRDLAVAQKAIALIESRGFARRRNLKTAYRRYAP